MASARMLRSWALQSGLRIELHLTPDIVSLPPLASRSSRAPTSSGRTALVNPANEALVGTRLPYFPMANEPPPGLQHSHWCGMEAGAGMFYPMQVIDGLVHQRGGRALLEACQRLPEVGSGIRCRVGGAVVTEATGDLRVAFDRVVHTVPPLYGANGWAALLASCYSSALAAAWCEAAADVVIFPLLGAGARGAPVVAAAQTAAAAVCGAPSPPQTGGLARVVCFGVREEAVAAELEAALNEAALAAG